MEPEPGSHLVSLPDDAMFIALASLFLNTPMRSQVAMTGEISLRGLVLPVGP